MAEVREMRYFEFFYNKVNSVSIQEKEFQKWVEIENEVHLAEMS